MSARADEISNGLSNVKERVSAAVASAGRSLDEITFIAVTKTYPISDVVTLHNFGVNNFGENRSD